MAALEAAIQSLRVRAAEDFFVSLDGRVKPGHDEDGDWSDDCDVGDYADWRLRP